MSSIKQEIRHFHVVVVQCTCKIVVLLRQRSHGTGRNSILVRLYYRKALMVGFFYREVVQQLIEEYQAATKANYIMWGTQQQVRESPSHWLHNSPFFLQEHLSPPLCVVFCMPTLSEWKSTILNFFLRNPRVLVQKVLLKTRNSKTIGHWMFLITLLAL